jgi:hypothetical protein
VPPYILLLNWVAEKCEKMVVYNNEIKCKRDLLIKSKDNPASQSCEALPFVNVSDLKKTFLQFLVQKIEMCSVMFDINHTHFCKILLL